MNTIFLKTLTCFLFISSYTAYCQVQQEWVQRFTSDSVRNEAVNDMFVDAQGNVYVTGSQRQTTNTNIQSVTVKYNSQGVQQWIQNYIAPNDNGAFTRAIHVDAAGNVYVTGESDIYSGGANKMLVIKYSPSGTQLWSYLFQYVGNTYCGGFDIVTDLTGNVYVTGEYATNVTTLNNVFVAKFSPSGALIGQTFYHYGSEGGRKIALDGAGKIIIGGYCNINQPDSNRLVVIKYEQNLDFVWATRCGFKGSGSPATPIDMVVDINSNPVITTQNDINYATYKINADGTLAWNKFYNYSGDTPRSIVADNSGNIYVTGETGTPGFPLTYRMTTIKYNYNGDEQWVANFNADNSGHRAYDIAVDNNGNTYIIGVMYSNSNITTLKYNSSGSLQWARYYNGPNNSNDEGVCIAVDGAGNTYSAGNSIGNNTGYDIAIIKYSPVSLFAANFKKNALSKNITDNQNTFDTISVDYTAPVNYYVYDVNLKIDTLLHTNDADLEVYLIHNGVTDTAVYQVGGTGDNFINTVLNDSSANSISGGTAPFTGSFKPSKPLSIFNNSNINGSWILKIYDRATGNTGMLKAWSIDFVIGTNPIGIQNISGEIPEGFSLSQNFPNPFNPYTNINFSIPKKSFVKIAVYDMLGREVAKLVNEELSGGVYQLDFDASKLASGVYFYRIEAGEYSDVKKMMIVK